MHRECDHDGAIFSSSDVDVPEESRQWLEEYSVAKWNGGVHLFDSDRSAAAIVATGYIPAIRYLL